MRPSLPTFLLAVILLGLAPATLRADEPGKARGLRVVRDTAPSPVFSRLPEKKIESLRAVPGVRFVAPEVWGVAPSIDGVPASAPADALRHLLVDEKKKAVGTLVDRPIILGWDAADDWGFKDGVSPDGAMRVIRGRSLATADAGSNRVLIGQNMVQRLDMHGAKAEPIGKKFSVGDREFLVVGVYGSRSKALDDAIVMDIAAAREILGVAEGTVSSFLVEVEDPERIDAVALAIEKALPDADARRLDGLVQDQAVVEKDKKEAKASDVPRLLDQPVSEYKARRKALMDRVKELEGAGGGAVKPEPKGGDGAQTAPKARGPVIVLVGETDEPEDARFRQSNYFAYLTGVDSPGASLILLPDEGKETLYMPPRNKRMEAWTGPKIGPGPEGVAATGFDRVEPSRSFQSDLLAAIGEAERGPTPVYVLMPYSRVEPHGPAGALSKLLREKAPSAKLKDVSAILGELRKVKSESEIALLRKAIALTGDAQAAAIKLLGPGVPEYRIEGAILGAFIGGGGMRAGFPSIVGSGLNSTVLHYNANRRTMQDGDLVVIDIGAEYFYYTADITRTYPVNGKFTPRQREIYQLVLDAQTAAAREFKVGVTTLMFQGRIATGVMRKSPLRAKDENGVEHSLDHFFIHGLGHYLGMDVHDVGNGMKPMQPGEVFTIEPGIYIPSEGFGVRIEDDYLVTKDGLEKLSKDIPSDPDEIERLIAQSRTKATAAGAVSTTARP
jgi:Xaa-Pro aminopeptidase